MSGLEALTSWVVASEFLPIVTFGAILGRSEWKAWLKFSYKQLTPNGPRISMPGTILIIEDDRSFRAGIVRYLRRLQFTVLEACESEQALRYLETESVELVLLDIGLGKAAALRGARRGEEPGCGGYGLLEIIRARSDYISIIILTALSEPIFEIACLQRGADDFVLKGVSLETLAARIQCCLRRGRLLRCPRQGPAKNQSESTNSAILQSGDFVIDTKHQLVRIGGGSYIHLSALEIQLLTTLASDPGRIFSRHQLLEAIWGADAKQAYSAVDALMKKLRRKIEPNGTKRHYVLNARGLGYRLNVTAWKKSLS